MGLSTLPHEILDTIVDFGGAEVCEKLWMSLPQFRVDFNMINRGVTVVNKRSTRTYLFGLLHSFGGEPSIVTRKGTSSWHWLGKLHRVGGLPAVNHPISPMSYIGLQEWWWYGMRHRAGDLPARVEITGLWEIREWYKYNRRHRVDGPAVEDDWMGRQEWFYRGMRHRDGDLPAIVDYHGETKIWYYRGNMHRDGGRPAEEYSYHETVLREHRIIGKITP